jgi:hypothetical protein
MPKPPLCAQRQSCSKLNESCGTGLSATPKGQGGRVDNAWIRGLIRPTRGAYTTADTAQGE